MKPVLLGYWYQQAWDMNDINRKYRISIVEIINGVNGKTTFLFGNVRTYMAALIFTEGFWIMKGAAIFNE